jgi:hypothetical protein
MATVDPAFPAGRQAYRTGPYAYGPGGTGNWRQSLPRPVPSADPGMATARGAPGTADQMNVGKDIALPTQLVPPWTVDDLARGDETS